VDTFKADLHFLPTKMGGLSQKFGIFATKPGWVSVIGLESMFLFWRGGNN
jgi:hypothetical protein